MVNLYKPLNGNLNIPKNSDYLSLRKGGKIHYGVDYSAVSGTSIYSSTDGWVIFSGIPTNYGNTIVIEHRDGTSTLYAHMKDLSEFKIGDYVGVRKKIGEVGDTGRSKGSHLHFEHIDKEGTEQIKKCGKQGKLGLDGKVHRLNPHDNLKGIGGQFIWHSESEKTKPCDDCLARDGKIYTYGEDIEPPLHPNCDCWIEDYDGTDVNKYNLNYDNDVEEDNSEENNEDKEKAREIIEELQIQLINLNAYLKNTENLYKVYRTQDLKDKIDELNSSINEINEEIEELNEFINDENEENKSIKLRLETKFNTKNLIKKNLEEFYYNEKFILYLRKGITF